MSNNNYRLPTYYIYLITNNINGKTYVGQRKCHQVTKNPWNDGYMGSGKLIVNAQKKYGIENFSKEILAICHTQNIIDILEIYFIKYYREFGKAEYNIANGGLYNTGGHPISEETRRKMREHNSTKSPETRKKISEKLKGRVFTEEWRRHISESHSGEKHPNYGKHLSEETKRRIGESQKGKIISAEARQKISEHNKSSTPEVKEKLRKANLGKHISEETKKKISKANKGKTISEEHKQALREFRLGKPLTFTVWNKGKHGIYTEEQRKRMSETHKGKKLSKEAIEKRIKTVQGQRWWTNGIESTKSKVCPGEGWYIGRTGDYKEKMSKVMQGHLATKGSKGMHWYNNGIINLSAYECPEGFVPGRLKSYCEKMAKMRKENPIVGIHWWTNGVIDTHSVECPGEGWYIGRSNEEAKRKVSEKRKGKSTSAKGTSWFTDGTINVRAKECPEGFRPGRSDAVKQKLSECGKLFYSEGRHSKDGPNRNKHWYNNGTVQVFALSCPEGFGKGRLR